MSLTTHRVIQYIVIITLCTLAGGGYWYWKDQQAKAAVALKTATDTGLVGYWSFDEGSGTKAEDFSPDGTNTGTLTNSPTWVDGKVGKALSFDGTNQYVTMGNTNDISTGDFTIAFWMNPDNVSQMRHMVSKRENGGYYRQYQVSTGYVQNGFPVNGKQVSFFGHDGSNHQSIRTTNDVIDGAWHHVTVTRTSSGILIYIDGVSVSVTIEHAGISSENFTNSANFNIGYDNGSNYYKGLLDEVRVYNRALSGTEITNLYQTSAKASMNTSENSDLTSGLVGLWSFNGADVSGTTAYDRSGQGNDGTLTNSPTVTTGKIGQALDFDGVNDHVYIGSGGSTTLFDTTKPLTVSVWTYLRNYSTTYPNIMVLKSTAGNSLEFFYSNSGGYEGINFGSGSATFPKRKSASASIPNTLLNSWHHTVLVFDGVSTSAPSSYKLYLDGIEIDTMDTATLATPANISSIGWITGSQWFPGKLDDVRVYNRTLSATEIWNLYQAGGGANVNSADSQSDALERGLAGYWKLDDGSGTSATDASTNGNTGTLTNGPTWTTGQIGGAVSFDGTDDYIIEAGTTKYKFTSSFAFGGWFKSTANEDNRPVAGFDSGSSDRYNLVIDNSGTESLGCNVRLTGGLISATLTTTVVTNSWYHLYCSYDDSLKVVTLYANGAKVATSSTGSGSLTDGGFGLQKFAIGRSNGSSYTYWTGIIDEVRLYNRSLSAEEIAKLYQSTAPDNPDTGLKGYWSFNGPDVSGTTAFDRSGVGNNGTLTNGPTVALGKIGQALSFDGNDDYVSAGDVNAVDGASTVTLSGWFKRGASNAHLTVGKTTNAGRTFSINFYNDGRAYVNVGTGGGVNSYGYFNSNDTDWHHVVFVFDGNLSGNANRAKAYLDGVQQSLTFSNTIPAATQASSDNFEIGRDQTLATYSSGGIDEVRLYSRAFTQTEVTNLYNLGR